MNATETWREAFNAWWRSRPVCVAVKSPRGFAQMVWQAAFKASAVTVTTDSAGNAIAVTRTDADGRVLSVIWERGTISAPDAARRDADLRRLTAEWRKPGGLMDGPFD